MTVQSNQSIKRLVMKSICLAALCVLVTVTLISLYLNYQGSELEMKRNFIRTQAILARLLSPSVEISDTSESRKLLNWLGNDSRHFGIVTQNNDLILGDYKLAASFSALFSRGHAVSSCRALSRHSVQLDGSDFNVYCLPIVSDKYFFNKHASVPNLAILIGLSKFQTPGFYTYTLFILLVITLITLSLIMLLISAIFNKKLVKPLVCLKEEITATATDPMLKMTSVSEVHSAPAEIVAIRHAFEKLIGDLKREFSHRIDYDKKSAQYELAKQIAHDIRSPLTALNAFSKEISHLPENHRNLMRNATLRITDIANNLLHDEVKQDASFDVSIRDELLSDCVLEVVSEKRLQYKNSGIDIVHTIEDEAYLCYARIEAQLFKRSLSNIIDNAVQASAREGTVKLKQEKRKGNVVITISDCGGGIDQTKLDAILAGQYTSKPQGTGLGLSSAYRNIRRYGGDIEIDTSDRGTHVSLAIPTAVPPCWAATCLYLTDAVNVVVCDDDQSIHDLWCKRISKLQANAPISMTNFYDIDHVRGYSFDSVAPHVFLIDYEFVGSQENGLDLVAQLQPYGVCYLVTSHSNETALRQQALSMDVKIISKNIASEIPIKVISTFPQTVLIDDSVELAQAWDLHAIHHDVSLECFYSILDAKYRLPLYSRATTVYIDSDFSGEAKGEAYSKQLHAMGFTHLYLTTGHAASEFSHCTWLKGVVGKTPPF